MFKFSLLAALFLITNSFTLHAKYFGLDVQNNSKFNVKVTDAQKKEQLDAYGGQFAGSGTRNASFKLLEGFDDLILTISTMSKDPTTGQLVISQEHAATIHLPTYSQKTENTESIYWGNESLILKLTFDPNERNFDGVPNGSVLMIIQ